MCKRCSEARKLLEEWAGKQGHDRCWYYPEIFRKIATILGANLDAVGELPPRAEFEEGCRKYQDEVYP